MKLIFLLLIISISSCSLGGDFLFRYYNTEGYKNFEKSYYKEAKNSFQKASKSSSKLGYIGENNEGITNYEEMDYENAVEVLKNLVSKKCVKDVKKYCDQIYYNIGNTYYRLGEKSEDDEKKKSFWNQAITSYQKDLDINNKDTEAKENIEFIQKKLQELENKKQQENQSQKGQQSNENQQSQSLKDSKSSKGEQGEKNGSNSEESSSSKEGQKEGASKSEGQKDNSVSENKEGDNSLEQSDGEKSKNSESNKGDNKNENKGEGEQPSENENQLNDYVDKQLNQYLEDMQNQEKNLQEYFNQNPNSKQESSGDPFDNFFDDPFFKQFFNNQRFGGKLGDENKSEEKDW